MPKTVTRAAAAAAVVVVAAAAVAAAAAAAAATVATAVVVATVVVAAVAAAAVVQDMEQGKKSFLKNYVSQVTSIETHTFFESGHELLHIDRYRSDFFSYTLFSGWNCSGWIVRFEVPHRKKSHTVKSEVPSMPSLNMNDAFRTEGYHIEEYLLSMGLRESLGIAKEQGNERSANQPYFGCGIKTATCNFPEQPARFTPERNSALKHEEVPLKTREKSTLTSRILEERTFLVEFVFREGGKYTEKVKQKFRERFPESALPNRDTVRDLIAKFRKTGSVHDAPRSGRPPVLTEEKLLDISDIMLRSPSKSVRKLAQETNISVCSAHTAVQKALYLVNIFRSVIDLLQNWLLLVLAPFVSFPMEVWLAFLTRNQNKRRQNQQQPVLKMANSRLKHVNKVVDSLQEVQVQYRIAMYLLQDTFSVSQT
ncbi:hypothetical protein ANN_06267 [Periplaneta americana]|uniref:DUF4817 domain-containing protein n=1 Tax=Periplaneta americana TaxID=6978 RepID=A0ABQ8TD42_PERAM|nr:hypothetical protein ANN_06267 [Periplaneta americana]